MEIKLIDGEKIYFLEKNEFLIFLKEGIYRFLSLDKYFLRNIVYEKYKLAERYPELLLGFSLVGIKKLTVPYMFLKVDIDTFQRIGLRNIRCPECNWIGMVGYPDDYLAYYAVNNEFNFKKAYELSKNIKTNNIDLNCTSCKKYIFKGSIWIGE